MDKKILVINYGSTSSKFGVFMGEACLLTGGMDHSREELSQYGKINDQLPMRYETLMHFLDDHNLTVLDFDIVIGRAGGTSPIQGVYAINERMVDKLLNRSKVRHVSNLSSVVAFELAKNTDVPAYTCSFAEDSMFDYTKISGLPQITRSHEGHMENWYAVSRMLCDKLHIRFNDSNIIVAHMGGGTTMGLYINGKIRDVIGDTEGAFGPERSGGLPIAPYLELAMSGQYSKDELRTLMRGNGGLFAYLGTFDARKVIKMIESGDQKAETVFKAMALQEAKAIAALSATACGRIDGIALSGGLANSKLFVSWIKEMAGFIAPIEIFPGEFEMEAMVRAVIEATENEGEVHEYTKEVDSQE